MVVVPPRLRRNHVSTVSAAPSLLVPEGQQEVTAFEGSGHLRRLALLEIQLPARRVGISLVRDFGMARDRETVRFEELDGLALAGWPLDFSRKHPVLSANGGEVAGFDPAHAFIGMPSFGPAPQRLEDRMID